MQKLGLDLDELGTRRLRWRRASDLVEELLKETGSHLSTSIRGDRWVASFSDVAQIAHAEWFMNANRDRERAPEPIRLPRPWPDREANADITDDERAELERQLLARSALRDR